MKSSTDTDRLVPLEERLGHRFADPRLLTLALSHATMRTIKQNLFWAFAYNVILIPIAILSPVIPFLQENAPIFAAAAMALSSVTVVSNSLRLGRFRRLSLESRKN